MEEVPLTEEVPICKAVPLMEEVTSTEEVTVVEISSEDSIPDKCLTHRLVPPRPSLREHSYSSSQTLPGGRAAHAATAPFCSSPIQLQRSGTRNRQMALALSPVKPAGTVTAKAVQVAPIRVLPGPQRPKPVSTQSESAPSLLQAGVVRCAHVAVERAGANSHQQRLSNPILLDLRELPSRPPLSGSASPSRLLSAAGKPYKVSVSTQCVPQDIIVLSDSD